MCRLSTLSGSQCPPLPFRSRQLKDNTLNVPEGNEYVDYLISTLLAGGVDAQVGSCKGEKSCTGDKFVAIYGKPQQTDCRGAGMKRIGLYHKDGQTRLDTWGMTESEIRNENLDEWVDQIKKVCTTNKGWLTVDSEKWGKEWGKRGLRGDGFTCRFLIVDGMKNKELCDIIKELIS